jgi:hypothetical protein
MVSEKSHADAWSKVAVFVQSKWQEGVTIDGLKAEFKVVEKQVMKDFDKKRMPASWRSAKSTALSAVTHNICLLDAGDKPMPKTDVGKLIRASKAGIITLSPLDQFKKHVDHAMTLYVSMTGSDAADARSVLIGLGTAVGMVPAKRRTGSPATASS